MTGAFLRSRAVTHDTYVPFVRHGLEKTKKFCREVSKKLQDLMSPFPNINEWFACPGFGWDRVNFLVADWG